VIDSVIAIALSLCVAGMARSRWHPCEVGDTAYRLLICLERERRGAYTRSAVSSAYAEQYTLLVEFIE
jgi:hypothetical protein